jgi:hypothetical protein
VYESKRVKESKPLSQAMKEGREPLRTFGDLKRYFQPEAEPAVEEPAPKKRRKPPEPPAQPSLEPEVPHTEEQPPVSIGEPSVPAAEAAAQPPAANEPIAEPPAAEDGPLQG